MLLQNPTFVLYCSRIRICCETYPFLPPATTVQTASLPKSYYFDCLSSSAPPKPAFPFTRGPKSLFRSIFDGHDAMRPSPMSSSTTRVQSTDRSTSVRIRLAVTHLSSSEALVMQRMPTTTCTPPSRLMLCRVYAEGVIGTEDILMVPESVFK